MKKTDVFLQSISIVAGLLMAVRALIVDETFFMSILYLQFVLLVWQLVSAIFLLKKYPNYTPQAARLVRIFLICSCAGFTPFGWPVLLFYYFLTLKTAFGKPKRRTFIDII